MPSKVSFQFVPICLLIDLTVLSGFVIACLFASSPTKTSSDLKATMEGGKPTVIANAEGFRTTPSVVAYTKNQDQLVGQIAKRQAVMNPENTFYSAKRFVGRRVDEVNEESKEVSYSVEKSGSSVKLKCPILDKQFSPEEVSSQVLRKLADDAGKYLV